MLKFPYSRAPWSSLKALIFGVLLFISPLSAKDSPLTSLDPSVTASGKGSIACVKQNSILKFSVACAEGLSVSKTYYKIDDAKNYSVYNGPVELNKAPFGELVPGKHIIYYYSEDTGANVEKVKSSVIYLAGTVAAGSVTNYPNPFQAGRENTSIEYNIEKNSDVAIKIYDLLGNLVWQQDYKVGAAGGTAGVNTVPWDGKNGSGETVANGGYICRITVKSGSGTTTLKRKIGVVK